ncbi:MULTISPECIES: acyltransferase family protein [Paenibacillus]|uniref:acyltransferase family protein n=1 Tax=Paenibacillus TaxID=44249 RepID=UPI002DBD4E47|nr:acyltransferase family protein [Paenibacillus odorifer]MEC0133481.1 acyltransferase family protein [Paenibacillus odorifer]MEC0224800.1 acyltransferase family protein [Paenibacillus odorifer]
MNDNKRYMPGIDGLRAFSVLAVIAYHLNLKWAGGGLLGVGIFFVISGYLITDQIINQWERHRRLDLLDFWIRRARRLLPATIVMLIVVTLWLLIIDPTRLNGLTGDFMSSLFYVNNWWLIFHDVSYFESFGPPSPIGHLWSLSIEEQFYILWPLLLVLGLKIIPRRGKLIAWILACAAVSALAMAMFYVPGTDPSRVYYGTDTRIFALLVGAALAVAWPSQKLKNTVTERSRYMFDIIGALGLLVLMVLVYRINEFDESLYRGGFLIISIITAVVIAVLAHPASSLGRKIGCKPLRWIGVRSYSLYLWHYPVIILTSPNGNPDESGVLRMILQLAGSFLLAALSYKYVEEPLRRKSLRNIWNHWSAKQRRSYRPVFLMTMIFLILIPIACNGYLSNAESDTRPIEVADKENVQQEGTALDPIDHNSLAPPVEKDTTDVEKQKPDTEEKQAEREGNIAVTEKNQTGKNITAIGDSVILDAAPFLVESFPGIVIDGKVGRQMMQAQEVVDQLRAQGRLGKRMIIELGTNGAFNSKQLRKLLNSLSDAEQIILVNIRVPRKWEQTVNSTLSKVSSEFRNTTIVDWYSASEGKDDYFYKDGVHLKREGAKYYASILIKALEKENK